jgi:glycosyltransferase involved in cell wall biosynthesis
VKNINIVQTFFIDANIFGTMAAKAGGANVIISSRRDLGYWYTPSILFVFKVLKIFTTRYLANSLSVRDCVSVREGVRKDKIDVHYNGIEVASYRYREGADNLAIRNEMGARSGDPIVGIVANLNRPVKGVDSFLRAASEVLGRRVNTLFVIVGDGHLKTELVAMAERLDIGEQVRFLGSKENVVPYIQAFDVAVNSSESEGFSNAVLEYMACGIPVVATNNGGSAESVIDKRSGFLIPPNDHVSLASAIIELLDNPEKARAMGGEGKKIAETKFSMELAVKKLEQYYRETLFKARG